MKQKYDDYVKESIKFNYFIDDILVFFGVISFILELICIIIKYIN